jgi:dihydrofolate reductase
MHEWVVGFEQFWSESFLKLNAYVQQLRERSNTMPEVERESASARALPRARGWQTHAQQPGGVRRAASTTADLNEKGSVRHVSKVFFSVTMSLDGCIAPEFMQLDQPVEKWLPQWSALQAYVFEQRFFRENLKLGEGGETGVDNSILEETYNRTGASIMGKRMFDGGEHSWPEEAPFHTPVFVVTHEVRSPWERPGGTTFYFVNDGIGSALAQARTAAGSRDVRIAGGATMIAEYLNGGLVGECAIALSPVLLGNGLRLFGDVDPDKVGLSLQEAIPSPLVTHLRYGLSKKGD